MIWNDVLSKSLDSVPTSVKRTSDPWRSCMSRPQEGVKSSKKHVHRCFSILINHVYLFWAWLYLERRQTCPAPFWCSHCPACTRATRVWNASSLVHWARSRSSSRCCRSWICRGMGETRWGQCVWNLVKCTKGLFCLFFVGFVNELQIVWFLDVFLCKEKTNTSSSLDFKV